MEDGLIISDGSVSGSQVVLTPTNGLTSTTNTAVRILNTDNFTVANWTFPFGAADPGSGNALGVEGGSHIHIHDIVVSNRPLKVVNIDKVTIEDSNFSYGGATSSQTGLLIQNSDNITVTDVIADNRNTGLHLSGVMTATVNCSAFTHNLVGVKVNNNSSTNVTLVDSHFADNSNDGVDNAATLTVLAENNYWGASDGPSTLGGSGNGYSGSVDADPFLAALPSCLQPPAETCNGLTATIVGTAGDDTLLGTAGDDVIVGLAGNDIIRGGGDDVICGGDGNDSITGGYLADWIDGEAGDDVVSGNDGDDTLLGSEGSDSLYGGADDDACYDPQNGTFNTCETTGLAGTAVAGSISPLAMVVGVLVVVGLGLLAWKRPWQRRYEVG